MSEIPRREEFRRNENLETLLREVNGLLAPVESEIVGETQPNKYPVTFIMGVPRSGTTLFLQWLAGLGCFSYPTNILSRFYQAPYIGAKIQLMLTKHDFNNEIFNFNPSVPFESRLGKTKGALAPNEFWYFWRRFFNFGEIQQLSPEELASVDAATLVSELSALEAAFGDPFALKGMILNWHIPFLDAIMGKALFIHVRRHPLYTIQSLLKSRVDYFGDIANWYSFKPPEYNELKKLSPLEQVAGQVYYTRQAVEQGLEKVAPSRKLVVDYENFCGEPEKFFTLIRERFYMQNSSFESTYQGPASFADTNRITLSDLEVNTVAEAYERFSGTRII